MQGFEDHEVKRRHFKMYYEEIRLYEDREDVRLTTYILDDSVEMLNGGKKAQF